MNKLLTLSLFFLIGTASFGQSPSTTVYKLEKGDMEKFNIPEKLLIKPNGEIILPEGATQYDSLFFSNGKIFFKSENGTAKALFELEFKSGGKLKGKVETSAGASENLTYGAYFSCSNHDPQHLCKLGDDPKDCGKSDCVW